MTSTYCLPAQKIHERQAPTTVKIRLKSTLSLHEDLRLYAPFDGSWARKIAIRNQYTYDGTSTEMTSMIPPKSPIITESGQRYTIILRAVGHVAQLFLQIQDFQEACGRRILERRGELTYTRCTRLGGAIGFRPQVPLRFGVAVVDGRLRHGET